MGACDSCPDYIKARVERPVSQALAQVRAVNKIVEGFNSLVRDFTDDLVNGMVSDINGLAVTIPDPPTLNIGEIIGLLTCPLVPIALAVDPAALAQLDPKKVVEMIRREMKAYVNQITDQWTVGLRNLQTWQNIRNFDRFFNELKRLKIDAELVAEASAVCFAVEAVCRDYYQEGPFEEFIDEVSSFSLNGLVPSSVNVTVQPVLDALQTAENKMAAWRLFVAS